MRITTAWAWNPRYPDEGPTLVSAFDENTADNWGKPFPDFFGADIDKVDDSDGTEVRLLMIDIDPAHVDALFSIPLTVGKTDGTVELRTV